MIQFLDGPAAEAKGLLIRRAPFSLRVVRSPAGVWDCLDQLDDEPAPDEAVYAYDLVGKAGTVHLNRRDKEGRHCGGTFVVASYRLSPVQPDDDTLRGRARWRAWAEARLEAFRVVPPGMPGECRSCKAPIRWVHTEAGSAMPLDPDPSPEGNVVMRDDKAVVLAGTLFEARPDGPRYLSHFATCPDAKAHRRPK